MTDPTDADRVLEYLEAAHGGKGRAVMPELEHATELCELVEVRRNQSYCIEPECEYSGKPAVQGHCYHRLKTETDRYLANLESIAKSELAFYQERHSGDEYVKTLEAMFLTATINWHSTLDECIRLRRENVALKSRP